MTDAAPRSGRLSADDWAREALEQIADAGVIVVKFWLAIDKQTQMERFQAREAYKAAKAVDNTLIGEMKK